MSKSNGAERKLIFRVHVQHANGSASDGGFAVEMETAPVKMLSPSVAPRMKQCCHLMGLRVDSSEVWAFVKITVYAGQRQVVQVIGAAVNLRENVFDVENRQWRIILV